MTKLKDVKVGELFRVGESPTIFKRIERVSKFGFKVNCRVAHKRKYCYGSGYIDPETEVQLFVPN